ncbi:hypothetical protein LCGC14_0950960 [marine sediment metagenome]|uniref:Uncharacterized protein n=1 Tax=marine sediment metagenome TaxID=412755 RepID=A0A0F9P3F0_9ZZZZ
MISAYANVGTTIIALSSSASQFFANYKDQKGIRIILINFFNEIKAEE